MEKLPCGRAFFLWKTNGTFFYGLLVMAFTVYGASASMAPKAIPPIDAQGIDALLQERQHPTIVAAMAAWCKPCIAELPILEKLHHKYQGRGLKIVIISLDFNTPKDIIPILKDYKITIPAYWGGEPAIQKLKIRAIPLLIFIRKGMVVKKLVGAQSHKTIERYIQNILK
jgi:thiol-disulfide isomerase/thioredoxin